jgi:hypothetical protein
VPNACKSNAAPSGAAWRTAEEHVATCPAVGDNGAKAPLIPHVLASLVTRGKLFQRRGRGLRPIRWLAG